MKQAYTGGCHCGAARFEADIDLNGGTFKCNCPMCLKTRLWAAIARPGDFRLLSGSDELQDYQPDHNHHFFCKRCGVRSFARGEDDNGTFYAVRVTCLDNVDV